MDESMLEAAELAQLAQVENSINQQHIKAMPDGLLAPHQFIAYDCEECGEPLCWFRMQKGRKTCVPCQSNIEKGRKATDRAKIVD